MNDDTRPITPLHGQQPPPIPVSQLRAPRLYGWNLAFTIVGCSVCFVILVTIVVAVVFADRLPPP